MPELKGSRTEANLAAAFAGESQASIKYAYYAAQARKEGHIEVSDIFSETAANEHAHGKIWFKLLHDGQVPGTEVNLMDAAQSEHYERSEMYIGFAREAEEEGFTHIAALFRMVAQIEHRHELRFLGFHTDLEEDALYQKERDISWICGASAVMSVSAKMLPKSARSAHTRRAFSARQTSRPRPPGIDLSSIPHYNAS